MNIHSLESIRQEQDPAKQTALIQENLEAKCNEHNIKLGWGDFGEIVVFYLTDEGAFMDQHYLSNRYQISPSAATFISTRLNLYKEFCSD